VGDWLAAAGIGLGLGLVLSTRDAAAASNAAGAGGSLVPVLAAVLIAVVALVVLSRDRSAPVRAALLSVAAGVLFGVGAALTKLTAATAVTSGFAGLLTSWPGYLLAAVSVASFALQQAAYTVGMLAPAVTAVVVVDPLVSYVLGVAAFGEPLPAAGAPMVQAALGMVVQIVSVALLARSPLLQPAASGRPEPLALGGQGVDHRQLDDPAAAHPRQLAAEVVQRAAATRGVHLDHDEHRVVADRGRVGHRQPQVGGRHVHGLDRGDVAVGVDLGGSAVGRRHARHEPVGHEGAHAGRVGPGERAEEPPYDVDVVVPAVHADGRYPSPRHQPSALARAAATPPGSVSWSPRPRCSG
jgi:hypothetical protein